MNDDTITARQKATLEMTKLREVGRAFFAEHPVGTVIAAIQMLKWVEAHGGESRLKTDLLAGTASLAQFVAILMMRASAAMLQKLAVSTLNLPIGNIPASSFGPSDRPRNLHRKRTPQPVRSADVVANHGLPLF